MNTDRTLDPSRQENIDATRRIDTGSATIRANASTVRPASATVRSSAMMGGAFKPDSFEVQNDNVDDKFFLLKGNKYKNIQSLSENTGEAQVFLVEGENFADFVNGKKDSFAICFLEEASDIKTQKIVYGSKFNENDLAKNIFSALREVDKLNAKTVYVHAPSKTGVGLAVYNRLIRAAAFKVIKL